MPGAKPGRPQRTLSDAAKALYWQGCCNYRDLVKLRKKVASITEATNLIRAALNKRGCTVPIGRPPIEP